jgi:D-alanyl-D-alanine carboxypeptidase/D-alanyl-D-alanine-endopeptidase (penicillin-binding protein 4)
MAEQIVKTLGAVKYSGQGTTEKGVQVIREYLNSIGVTNFTIENGSGLSYKNQISSNEMMAVMKDMYMNQNLRDVFVDSLSVSGVDGTLKKWQSTTLNGRLRAKTGSLNGISSLSGFVPYNSEMIIFSIILNGHVDFTTGRKVSEKIVETLVDER